MGACHHNETIPFFYNSSGKELSRYWRTKDVLVVTLGLLVCVIVILANTLVIAAVVLNRRFHQPIFYLLANLAATDFFSGVAYTYLMFHTGPRTAQLTVHTWFLRQGLIDTSLTASVTNLLAVAVERHQTVFQMQLHSNMSNQRVTFLIACIWVTAIIMGLIPQMGWNCVCDLSTCSRMAPLYSRSYLVFWAISNLLIFCIMLLVYLRIFYYVKHKVQRMSQHTLQSRHKETMMNLMKTVVIILKKSPNHLNLASEDLFSNPGKHLGKSPLHPLQSFHILLVMRCKVRPAEKGETWWGSAPTTRVLPGTTTKAATM
ncbi:lysophosphatidic acid receptor 2-like isoform X3 [Narcine bancroftii]|uniref:lysophosphatidic acid receptor 2-like isoform X3 n=1 Tax=Narcine bancroftii TaxID=1343680 RepID=UPI0038320F70